MLLALYIYIFIEAFIIGVYIWDDDDTIGTIPTVLLFVGVAAFQIWTPYKVGTAILHNPLQTLILILSYFFTGGMWSIVKWWFAEKKRYRVARAHVETWSNPVEELKSRKTRLSDHRSTLLVWIGYWPFSLLLTAFNDPLRRFAVWIYELFESTYQRITDSVWS